MPNTKITDFQKEVSRTPPPGTPIPRFLDAEPILYAFGCALFEINVGDCYIYKAVNLETKKHITISRRKTPLAPNEIPRIAERISLSSVAGTARIEVDRPYGAMITYDKCRDILREIFNEILPKHGYAVRKEQIALSESILESIHSQKTTLAEAEVGTGKTHAYLVASILAKRGRLNDFWNKTLYPKMPYVDMAYMPIVIATSSIALQKAIVKDYIPELSQILLDSGVIKTPLTAVLRKGREHYVCDRNLDSHIISEQDTKMKRVLYELLKPSASIDLAEATGLNAHVKRQIRVPARCGTFCPYRETCRYQRFISKAMSSTIDIQVTNHNYLLADVLHRVADSRPLFPNYQIVVIDEAHKLLSAARSMYGAELSDKAALSIINYLKTIKFNTELAAESLYVLAKKLHSESKRLFRAFSESLPDCTDDDAERFGVEIDDAATKHLRNMYKISEKLLEHLDSEPVNERHRYRKIGLLWEIRKIKEHAAVFVSHKQQICWLEMPSENRLSLCSIPKDLNRKLFADFWEHGTPTVLTSGTLSAAGDFTHIKRTLGLDRLKNRITETSKPSPFNYRDNALIYITDNVPFPDVKNLEYISSLANEIERLIKTSHGHAAVLFTSYDAMGRVHAELVKRNPPFPLLKLERGSVAAIERFKQSKNGVLFASGALWEGIDIPGDALSMLIIVKLPFTVPDPIGEYEQTLYGSMSEYKNRVIVPEMLIKLKQGFGRLIRTETDTGVVAILDSRVSKGGAYRGRVLNALPECRVTADIRDVEGFIRAKKPDEYFK